MDIEVRTQAELDAAPAGARLIVVGGACENPLVAWDSAHVVARATTTVSVQAEGAEILLFGFAVAVARARPKIRKRSRSATVIRPKTSTGVEGWLDREGVEPKQGRATLFKRVSAAFLTQEHTSNETRWLIGSALEHPAWNPVAECGPGQFHACSRPYFCDEFRSEAGDRYVAISVLPGDLKATERPLYPHKIAFRAGRVMYECDRFGKKLEAAP